jgi:hypothetical protein
MFKNNLITNRGGQPLICDAAAQPNCLLTEDGAGDSAMEVLYV